MKTILATAIAAVTVAGLSFGAMAATTVTTTTTPTKKVVVVRHVPHRHMHKVCTMVWTHHHHHKATVCKWVHIR
jgi:hypothetical protein